MISHISSTLKIDHGVADGHDEGYIRLLPSKPQTEWLLIRSSLVVKFPLTVEEAARSRSGVAVSGDRVVGYRIYYNIMGVSE